MADKRGAAKAMTGASGEVAIARPNELADKLRDLTGCADVS